MALENGDFVEVEYTAWNDNDGSVLATTDEETAKSGEIYDEKVRYGSVLVVIGANAVVKGLERELVRMSVGETKSFVLQPEDAFGTRDENLVRVMKLSDFKAQNLNPYPGMRLNIDNAMITVKSVGSGRVVVDANHPDAGKMIKYQVKVVRKIEGDNDKMVSLAKTYDAPPTSVSVDGKTAEIFYDSKVKKDSNYFINKASSLAAIFSYLDDIDKIVVKEEYIKAREIKKEEPKKDVQE